MTTSWLTGARQVFQMLAALMCAALGLRIMIDAIGEARAAKVPAAPDEPLKPALLELADEMKAPAPTPAEKPAPPALEAAEPSRSLRLFLSVVVGPERSEVFVNGARLGLTPYLGDYTCKEGEPLSIEVVPSVGPLITRQARCGGQTLLIRND